MPMPNAMSRPVWLLAFALSLILITAGSLMPTERLPQIAFDIWDKAQHAAAFAWLTWTGLMAWRHPRHVIPVGIGLALWGGAIELLQSASGYRQGDWADLAADVLGIVFVLAMHRLMLTTTAARPG